MKVSSRKEVTRVELVIVAVKCDVCGKQSEGENAPIEWHSFSHHHNEWGNDSVESYAYYEVCSPECYWIKFRECVLELEGYNDAEIDEFSIQFARKLSINPI